MRRLRGGGLGERCSLLAEAGFVFVFLIVFDFVIVIVLVIDFVIVFVM